MPAWQRGGAPGALSRTLCMLSTWEVLCCRLAQRGLPRFVRQGRSVGTQANPGRMAIDMTLKPACTPAAHAALTAVELSMNDGGTMLDCLAVRNVCTAV